MFMTPGLGFFYGGLVRRKNLVSTIVQCMAIFAVVSLAWAIWGYTMAFGPSVLGGFIGNFQFFVLNGVGTAANTSYSSTIPALLYFAFQLKFAAITPALIIGAFAGRIRLKPLLIFILAWVTFVYFPIAHWIWGVGGWLHVMGVEDFAGGMVVHTSAGVSALAAALVIGRGMDFGKESRPNNVPYVILGTAILWFGWFGFNAGSSLSANGIAVNALVTTNLAAAAAGMSWLLMDWIVKGRPSAVGMCVGFVCGLAAVTPASGYVGPQLSMVIGVVAGVACNLVAGWRARSRLDDSLDVFACHGVGGAWGTVATGLFASSAINAAGSNGLVYGNPHFALLQMFAVAVVVTYAFVGTYVILHIINFFSPLRTSPEEERAGLDEVHFGEEAYYPASE
jgi:Amt family ammonium transporter